jgi:hypothetical protein
VATAWQPTWGIWLGEMTHDVFTPCPRYLREPISASGLPITTDSGRSGVDQVGGDEQTFGENQQVRHAGGSYAAGISPPLAESRLTALVIVGTKVNFGGGRFLRMEHSQQKIRFSKIYSISPA